MFGQKYDPRPLNLRNLMRGDVWVDRDGHEHRVEEMPVEYCQRVLDYLWRRKAELSLKMWLMFIPTSDPYDPMNDPLDEWADPEVWYWTLPIVESLSARVAEAARV